MAPVAQGMAPRYMRLLKEHRGQSLIPKISYLHNTASVDWVVRAVVARQELQQGKVIQWLLVSSLVRVLEVTRR